MLPNSAKFAALRGGAPHPGARIRAEVIPAGMSVTRAAALMGVGRPALSNLLNEKAALSSDMASRLEKTFNYPRKQLLAMQAAFDAASARARAAPADARTYVPPFLGIKANHIEQWAAHNIAARSRLAVFLRTLVRTTGHGLLSVDFPGNDDAERPGWDGFVNASDGAPWVPAGRSGWEFGTTDDPKGKADADYQKSVKSHLQREREETTFVFVTPRRWKGKDVWAEAMRGRKRWKDVRAFDASDLEQWLEHSLPAQAWFAIETHLDADRVRTLEACWTDWANVSSPPMGPTFFDGAVAAAREVISARLSSVPDGPTLIAADSVEEALAFLSQVFSDKGGEQLAAQRDRVLVFDRPSVLPRLIEGGKTFIPVAHTREVERELAPYATLTHSFVIYPRNATTVISHVAIEPPSYEAFEKALQKMGKTRDQVARLARESGRSLAVLRRRLATVPAVQKPAWADEPKAARSLVPFMLAGAWRSDNSSDTAALSLLAADRAYSDLEADCQLLAQLNDPPVWSVEAHRGVVSKMDLLCSIGGCITRDDLRRYFDVARLVLDEDDPALDLDKDQRWAAVLHGRARDFSAAFRAGISETLVLLAVHGQRLFKGRTAIDTEVEATLVVRGLLPFPLTTRKLEANDRDLPTYAEAAPDEFLSILERDLASAEPAVLELLAPAQAGVLGHPSRTGLLWALEGLAWNPTTLPRAVFVLAQLAAVEINDNWVNKPAYSLASIFRAWMPQTAADLGTRVDLIKRLAVRFPDVAWRICVQQFGVHYGVGHYNHKPKWRTDGHDAGEPHRTLGPMREFERAMVDLALSWKPHTRSTLTDLVERLASLDKETQAKVWKLIDDWALSLATDDEKAKMRETIRICTLSRRAALREKRGARASILTTAAKSAYAALEPTDVLNKHAWLFRDGWIEESADEIQDIAQIDFAARQERIQKMRIAAMREVLDRRGTEGIIQLAMRGQTSFHIGSLACSDVMSPTQVLELLRAAFDDWKRSETDAPALPNLIAGALRATAEGKERDVLLNAVADGYGDDALVQLLRLCPFGRSAWRFVDALSADSQEQYWTEITADGMFLPEDENSEAVERLLKARRPRAAFSCIRFHPAKIEPQLLFRVLSAVMKGGADRSGEYLLDSYNLVEALKHLNQLGGFSVDEMALLELAFIDALSPRWEAGSMVGIPNLERYVEAHPELFVQAVAWAYRRKDGVADYEEQHVSADRRKELAMRGHKLLEALRRTPGHNADGVLTSANLAQWTATVRQSCVALGRAEIADVCIGKLFAYASVGEDGVWPCEEVRDVMEEIQSDRLMAGARTGVYNSRGVVERGEGGDQERELAGKYRAWGQALQISHPYVSSALLLSLSSMYEREGIREDSASGLRRRLEW